MKVSNTCTECGKPRDPTIKTIAYQTEDDELSLDGELPIHRAVFCSKECRIEFIDQLDPGLTDDELLAEIPQERRRD